MRRAPTALTLLVLATACHAPGRSLPARAGDAATAARPGEATTAARPGDAATAARRLAVADAAAAWLDAQAERTPAGVRWPVDARAREPRFDHFLYSGVPGVVLFYLEHHAATGRAKSLELARAGARWVWSRVGATLARQPKGLYTGVAGVAVMFAELHRVTRSPADLAKVTACVGALGATARVRGTGDDWNGVTDIISGTAGIGLALLRLANVVEHAGGDAAPARRLATRAGDGLLGGARAIGGRLRWAMSPSYPRDMPNFSHGTAGVAYFLARLHQVTGESRFLAAARGGAEYLLSITGEDGVIHHDDGDRSLFYLGWCHGPPGTARLFALLHAITGDARYRAWIDRAAAHVRASGIPAKRTRGFWNNHGQCCGTAGVADFFMHLRALDPPGGPEPGNRTALAAQFAALEAAAERGDGVRTATWTGAEHRVRPKQLSTQTGYAQGVAGIGTAFLHDAAWLRGAPRRIVLPDSPYPRR